MLKNVFTSPDYLGLLEYFFVAKPDSYANSSDGFGC